MIARRGRPAHRAVLMVQIVCLVTAHGCARTPSDVETGTRLIVQLRFAGPVNDNYHYYVLIRNGADPVGENGPIAVIEPPYGNGFATGRNTATAGFTDFVEYGRGQAQPLILFSNSNPVCRLDQGPKVVCSSRKDLL